MIMDDDDFETTLLKDLSRLVGRLDPPPLPVTAAAEAAFTWRSFDDDLAQLLTDSAEAGALAGVRAHDRARTLCFATDDVTIELEVSASGTTRSVIGQIVPAGPATVEVRHPGGATVTQSDTRGRFTATGVSAGVVSLRLALPGPGAERSIATPWLPI